jgi:eukaryotic-like serine/threonine-protein kinase
VAADRDVLPGTVALDRYRIEAVIGSGAMGTVYRARHIRAGREVAIKVLHDHLVRDPVMVQRFDREAAIAARLSHRNLVGVLDVGTTAAGSKLMVLELARGETLAAIAARETLPRERVVRILEQLLHGLEHAHAVGLVHRDLKPDNVIIEDDEARIVDFGIAVLRDGPADDAAALRLTACGTLLGTPAYMAPEQAQSDALDPRTDLFALGVIAYELVAGLRPFDGSALEVMLANANQDPPPIAERAPGRTVDPLLEAFARRLMARTPRDRFASARAALDALALIDRDRAAAARVLGETSPTVEMPVFKQPRRWPLATVVLVVGALLGFWIAS